MSPSIGATPHFAVSIQEDSVVLPEDLLDNLKEAHQVQMQSGSVSDSRKFQELVQQVKRIAGISSWNKTIDFLDNYKSDWRGYEVCVNHNVEVVES